MRGLKRAAALLLSSFIYARVIPSEEDSAAVEVRPYVDRRIFDWVHEHSRYRPSEAFLEFTYPCFGCSDAEKRRVKDAVFTIEVLSSEEGLTSENVPSSSSSTHNKIEVLLDGKALLETSVVPQVTTSGLAPLDLEDIDFVFKDTVEWDVTTVCLTSQAGKECPPEDIANVLVVKLFTSRSSHHPYLGFTVSYKPRDTPEILRFSLFATQDEDRSNLNSLHWQSPFPLAISNSGTPRIEFPPSITTALELIASSPTLSASLLPVWTSTFDSTYNGAIPSRTQPSMPQATLHGQHHGQQPISGKTVLLQPEQPQQTERLVEPEQPTEPELPVLSEMNLLKQSNHHVGFIEHGLRILENKATGFFHSLTEKFAHTSCKPELIAFKLYSPEQVQAEKAEDDLYVLEPQSRVDSTAVTLHPTGTPVVVPSIQTTVVAPEERNDQALRAFQITSLVVVIVVASLAIFAYLIRDPRLRVERAARREERRNYNLYRRAVYRQRVKTWYSKVRGLASPGYSAHPSTTNPQTWEEKRELALRQEETQAAVREELYALRNAHRVVDGLIKAEEGRQDVSFSLNSRIRRAERRERRERRARRDSEARSDRTGPPPYEEHNTMGAVVDGFGFVSLPYAPAPTDDTPDSSVIDTSPRTSIYMGNSDSEKE